MVARMDSTQDAFSDVMAPEWMADPFPLYDQLRLNDPVHRSPQGYWVLFRYDDARAALRDPRFSNRPARYSLLHARNREEYVASQVANRLVAFMDPPTHSAVRSELVAALSERSGSFARELPNIVARSLDGLPTVSSVDFVKDVAEPLAANLATQLLGLPTDYSQKVAEWASDFFILFHAVPDAATFDRLNDSLSEFREVTHNLVASRRQTQRDDLASAVVEACGEAMTPEEITDNLMLIAADAYGNVQAGLATCVAQLLEMGTLYQEAPLENGTVDECLRLESPGQFQGRITRSEVEIAGRVIPAHSLVYIGLASANRDAKAFVEPDRFEPNRSNRAHLAFGYGPHMCIGGALVRRTLNCALEGLRAARFRLALADEPMRWQTRPGHRWLASLPVNSRPVAQN